MSNKSFNIIMETQQDIHFVPLSHEQNRYFVMSFLRKDNALQKCKVLKHKFPEYSFSVEKRSPSQHMGNAFPEMFREAVNIMLQDHPDYLSLKKKTPHLTLVKG